MSFIHDIKMWAYHRSLKQQLRHRQEPTGKGEANLDNANSIGILFDATELSTRDTVLAYAEKLRKRNKRIKLLGYFDDPTDSENYPFEYYNRKQVDWASRPKGEQVQAFIKHDFDLLMNVNTVSLLHTEYIAALSNAKLRVGPCTEHTLCYDLMIDLSPQSGLKHFIEQAETLLGKTNIKHEAAPV
ncbi:MAG: hypothetical protein H6556_23925 [Lewinellaceae bacterium]|nr:hypothetical protein [Lewinellaceae bacterium]